MQALLNTPEKIVVRMDANVSLANAIRRSLTEIPTLAIDEVEIFKNDSALFDEILAHRLGLVPLETDKSMSEKTKIDLKLSKKGPCTVYSEDLEGSATVSFGKIPITLLGEGHKLELIATARLGNGREHDKHTPGLCFYRHLREVKSSSEADKIIQASKGLVKPEKKGGKWICDITDSEVRRIHLKDKGAVTDADEILLVIESYGLLSAKDILLGSISVLESDLGEFQKAIK